MIPDKNSTNENQAAPEAEKNVPTKAPTPWGLVQNIMSALKMVACVTFFLLFLWFLDWLALGT